MPLIKEHRTKHSGRGEGKGEKGEGRRSGKKDTETKGKNGKILKRERSVNSE